MILLVVVIAASCNCINSQEKSKTSQTSNSKNLPNVKTCWPSVLRSSLPRILKMAFKNKSAKMFQPFQSLGASTTIEASAERLATVPAQKFGARIRQSHIKQNLSVFHWCVDVRKQPCTIQWSTWERTMCGPNHQCLRNSRRYLARKENCL